MYIMDSSFWFDTMIFNNWGRRQSKMLLTIFERGSKSIETVFLIVICRQSGDKWQSNTLFLGIFDLRPLIVLTFSIVAYPVCLMMVLCIYGEITGYSCS